MGSLTSLRLESNNLNGSIPPAMGSLASLNALILSDNVLTGSIPPELGNLANLITLRLEGNSLGGDVGLLTNLGNLGNLKYLEIQGNTALTGAIPAEWPAGLGLLEQLHFNDTDICEPSDPAFQTWLAGLDHTGTGVSCDTSTTTTSSSTTTTSTSTTSTTTSSTSVPGSSSSTTSIPAGSSKPDGTLDQNFVISIVDRNDPPTEISLSSEDVNENQPKETAVGTLTAADQDAGETHTYTLVSGSGGTDNDSFLIDNNLLKTNEEFDFETKKTYSVRIKVTDKDEEEFAKSFTINVNDMNDPPTDIIVRDYEGEDQWEDDAGGVDENLAGERIGLLSSTDPDGDGEFTYTLISWECCNSDGECCNSDGKCCNSDGDCCGSDEACCDSDLDCDESLSFFKIKEDVLMTDQASDHETYQTCALVVETNDGGSGIGQPETLENTLTISIVNVNETPTDIVVTSHGDGTWDGDAGSVDENLANRRIGRLSTTDPDGGDTDFTYALVSCTCCDESCDDVPFFKVMGDMLMTGEPSDYEVCQSCAVVVRTDDGGSGIGDPKTWDKEFTISINDVNEAPTDIIVTDHDTGEEWDGDAGGVDENLGSKEIGRLSSTDPDGDTSFTYTLISCDCDDENGPYFKIEGDILKTDQPSDHETHQTCTVVVRTDDGGGEVGGESGTLENNLTISINNVNSDGLPESLAVSGLTLVPDDPPAIYAATNLGVYKTIDAGESWTPANTGIPESLPVRMILADPADPALLYAGTPEGVYKTTDRGETWIGHGDPGVSVRALAIAPADPGAIYMGGWGRGLSVLTDAPPSVVSITRMDEELTDAASVSFRVTFDKPVRGVSSGHFSVTTTGAASGTVTSISAEEGREMTLVASVTGGSGTLGLEVGNDQDTITDEAGVPLGGEGWGNGRFFDGEAYTLVVPGDTDGDGRVRLDDAVLALQVLTDAVAGETAVNPHADVDGDGRIGLGEAIFILGRNADAPGAGVEWRSHGPFGGTVSTLAISAADPSVLYAGTSQGVFRSADAGENWWPAGLADQDVNVLVADPDAPSVVYAGTDEDGIFRTADLGGTWTRASETLAGKKVTALVMAPDSPETLYAGTDGDGILKTTDAGQTWTPVNNGLIFTEVTAIGICPTDPSILHAGTERLLTYYWPPTLERRMFKSTDAGESWTQVANDIDIDYFETEEIIDIRSIVIDPTDPEVVWVAADNGLFISRDGGKEWRRSMSESAHTALIHPADPSIIYVATSKGIYGNAGTDGWQLLGGDRLRGRWVHALVGDPTDPSVFYVGTSRNGVFKSEDRAAIWHTASCGLPGPEIHELRADPLNPGVAYAGTEGGIYRTEDGGKNWVEVNPHGMGVRPVHALRFDPSDPETLYAGGDFRVMRTRDRGETWSIESRDYIVHDIAFDPEGERLIVAAHFGIASVRFDEETARRGSDRQSAGFGPRNASAIVSVPGEPAILYAGDINSGLYRQRVDDGVYWAHLASGHGLPGSGVSAIEPHPTRPDEVLYVGTRQRGVFMTTDHGESWTPVSYGFVNDNLNDLRIDAADPDRLVAGGEGGVFGSGDGGRRWTEMNNGLTHLDVHAVEIDPHHPDRLLAGTANGGVFVSAEAPPAVLSVTRMDDDPAAPGSVRFRVTFDEAVSGIDLGDFGLDATGSVTGTLASVSASKVVRSVIVTVDGVAGIGTLNLGVTDDDSVTDADHVPLGGEGPGNGDFTAGETYTLVPSQLVQ